MQAKSAIQVQNLHKNFGEVHAVQGVSFEVRTGEIFSLLGPNGAGKSTTISMLACFLFAYSLAFFVLAIWRFKFE